MQRRRARAAGREAERAAAAEAPAGRQPAGLFSGVGVGLVGDLAGGVFALGLQIAVVGLPMRVLAHNPRRVIVSRQ